MSRPRSAWARLRPLFDEVLELRAAGLEGGGDLGGLALADQVAALAYGGARG